MGILQIITDEPGQINQPNLRRVKIITTDNLSKVTTAGYLNPEVLQGFYIYNTDIIDMWYGASGNANYINSPGTYAEFYPTISNGVITLTSVVFPGGVTVSGSVTSGDLVSFLSSTQIKDVGYKILFGNSSVFGGGGTVFAFSVPGATINSISICCMKNQTNTSYITSLGTTANQISVSFNADPGINTVVNYITFVPNS